MNNPFYGLYITKPFTFTQHKNKCFFHHLFCIHRLLWVGTFRCEPHCFLFPTLGKPIYWYPDQVSRQSIARHVSMLFFKTSHVEWSSQIWVSAILEVTKFPLSLLRQPSPWLHLLQPKVLNRMINLPGVTQL